ncbi:hypothetical protein ZWY2020_014298 [Hordeum vulgare]|nr:hypothetical protein ZWY2020_014298 [Hordeum vulgare]
MPPLAPGLSGGRAVHRRVHLAYPILSGNSDEQKWRCHHGVQIWPHFAKSPDSDRQACVTCPPHPRSSSSAVRSGPPSRPKAIDPPSISRPIPIRTAVSCWFLHLVMDREEPTSPRQDPTAASPPRLRRVLCLRGYRRDQVVRRPSPSPRDRRRPHQALTGAPPADIPSRPRPGPAIMRLDPAFRRHPTPPRPGLLAYVRRLLTPAGSRRPRSSSQDAASPTRLLILPRPCAGRQGSA